MCDSRQKGGIGLGLNIARLIIEKHGGCIDFVSGEDIATTFYIELPIAKDEVTSINRESGNKANNVNGKMNCGR